jgi:plastocyanin
MLRRIGLITAALVLLSAASVSASTLTITLDSAAFPASNTVTIGDKVEWVNHSGVGHTVTGDAPLNLWDRSLPIDATVSRNFNTAGTFPYHCNIHFFMHGAIAVKMTSSAHSGTSATTFTLRWATFAAADGRRYIVQKRAPGGTFVPFEATSSPTGTFKTSIKGTWGFRARLKRVSDGAVSGFSPTLSIIVH